MGQADKTVNHQGFNVKVYVDTTSEAEARSVQTALQGIVDEFKAQGVLNLFEASKKKANKLFLNRFKA